MTTTSGLPPYTESAFASSGAATSSTSVSPRSTRPGCIFDMSIRRNVYLFGAAKDITLINGGANDSNIISVFLRNK